MRKPVLLLLAGCLLAAAVLPAQGASTRTSQAELVSLVSAPETTGEALDADIPAQTEETTAQTEETTAPAEETAAQAEETSVPPPETETAAPRARPAEQPPVLWDGAFCPMGDVIRDDVILAEDARLALRASVGLAALDAGAALLADVDLDGGVTAADARLILRMSVQLAPLLSHTPGPPAAVNVPQLCTRCGKELAPALPDPNVYTSKGFIVEVKNGITYIDGVMVVNKTYALPASYAPGGLTRDAQNAFSRMQAAARQDGIRLFILSGYRSYATQKNLFERYCAQDGVAAAERYSARPGNSEHQTGLAMDLNSVKSSFANTKEARWIAAHCWEYGFILRYPKGKEAQTGYIYEPWHVRYVGVDFALRLGASGLCLEEYFGIDSVYPRR